MATVYLARKAVLMVKFIQGTTISEAYSETLKKKSVGPAIQNKWHGMLTSAIKLLHNNVHLHTAAHTQARPEHFNWELFDHPP
jgi:hypothetical protein